MLKVFKYLKKSSFIIFIIILLLAGQASCELSLPTYTSNIINIGIQQGGIENSVPDVIRKSAMDNLFIFLNKKDKDTVLDNYKLLSKDSLSSEDYKTYKESYPALKDEELYLLNTKDKEKIEVAIDFQKALTRMLFVLLPLIIMTVILCFANWLPLYSFGMVMFWGIITLLIYNIVITRTLIVNAVKD